MIVINGYKFGSDQDPYRDINHICGPCNCDCDQCASPCQRPCRGGESEIQGDLREIQGDQSENQGDLTEVQGDQSENQGDLTEVQGDQSEVQGDLTETLGDLSQIQEGEAQGDQIQGDQAQSLTGHGGQTQGDQNQSLTGHGGQTQGDQSLISAPGISTPVTVSGVNLNVTVRCGGGKKKKKRRCCEECRDKTARLLCAVNLLQIPITDPQAAQTGFYYSGSPVTGKLADIDGNCFFTIDPASGENDICVSAEALEMLSWEATGMTPDMFSLLLSYLQTGTVPARCEKNCCEEKDCCDGCESRASDRLLGYQASNTPVVVKTAGSQAAGYVYKVQQGIVYLVEDLENPTEIRAIPICKIVYCQPQ